MTDKQTEPFIVGEEVIHFLSYGREEEVIHSEAEVID